MRARQGEVCDAVRERSDEQDNEIPEYLSCVLHGSCHGDGMSTDSQSDRLSQTNGQATDGECPQCLRLQQELNESKSQLQVFLDEERRTKEALEFAEVYARAGDRLIDETLAKQLNPKLFPSDTPERARRRAEFVGRLPPGWLSA